MYIFYKPPLKTILNYHVIIDTYNKEAKIQENNLSYTCSLSFIKETFKGYVVHISRKEMLLNNTKSHPSIKELMLVSGEIMNDICLEVSQYGDIIKIQNLKEIRQYWEEIKFKIEQTYTGGIVPTLVTSIEEKIFNEEKFIRALKKDPFLHNYFEVLYGEYKNNIHRFEEEITGFCKTPLYVKRKNVATIDNDIQVISTGTVEKEQNEEVETDGFKFETIYNLTEEKTIKKMNVFYCQEREDVPVKKMTLRMYLKK